MASISACIITKNESTNLEICLSRLKKYEIEIVVVDTGSTDDSIEVAKKFTDCVFEFPWNNDFSAARNFAIGKATGDYILIVDTDEFIDEIDMQEVNALINEHPNDVGKAHVKNLYVSNNSDMASHDLSVRLFPKSRFRYFGKIHEQVRPLPEAPQIYDTFIAPIYMTHVGYRIDSVSKKEKAERNLKLLMEEYRQNPDDTYIIYQIGKAYFFLQDYEHAVEYFEKATEYRLDTDRTYVRELIVTYAYSLINLEQYEKASALEAVYDDFKSSADFVFVMGLIYMYNARFDEAVKAFLDATSIPDCTVEGVNSYLAYYNIGVIYECLEQKDSAVLYYKKCKGHAPALEGIKRCAE